MEQVGRSSQAFLWAAVVAASPFITHPLLPNAWGNALSDVGRALLKVICRCRELLQPAIPAERFRHTWRGLGVPCHVLPSHLQRLLRSTRSVEPDLPMVSSLLALFSCEFETSPSEAVGFPYAFQ